MYPVYMSVKSDQIIDQDVREAFQKREMKSERRINYFRMIGLIFLSITDSTNFFLQGEYTSELIIFVMVFTLIFLSYFGFIHYITAEKQPYRPWVKYLTITCDYLMLVSITTDPNSGSFMQLETSTLGFLMLMLLTLINLLSALRHSRIAILYSTTLGSLSAILILNHLQIDPTLFIYGPAMMIITGLLTMAIANNMSSLFLKLRHRERLMRFLSPEIVEKLDSGSLKLELGGEVKEVTVLMTDIRGFTSLSEERDPHEVVALLNEYFTAMSNIIFKYGGTLDKFIGDAIMAVYGTPESYPDDTLRALKTAQEMIRAMEELNAKWKEKDFPELKMGIALHTGQVLAGNIGSPKRMEYTVIGDAVNVTSRIESMNKTYNTEILFTQETYSKIKDHISARVVGDAPVRGRKNQIQLYTLE